MKIVKPSFEVLTPINGEEILHRIEMAGRVCYKSEEKTTPESAQKFVRGILASGHHSVIEHESVSVRIICNRGITHELVRHRLGSYSQESTRYCNYGAEGNDVTFILEPWHRKAHEEYEANLAKGGSPQADLLDDYRWWRSLCITAEHTYLFRLRNKIKPQVARNGLPIALKTEIVATYNLREWRHIFNLRAAGTTGKPHPQMLEIMIPLLAEFKSRIPIIFDDITPMAMPEYK